MNMELLTVVDTVVALYICVHTVDLHNAVTDELGHVTQQDWKHGSFSDETLKCKTCFFSLVNCCNVF